MEENEIKGQETNENIEVVETTTVNSNETTTKPNESKGLSIASMVLGIIAVVFCCVGYLSIPCAILSIVFGILGRKRAGKGMATAGVVLGIIAIALMILVVVWASVFIAAIFESI